MTPRNTIFVGDALEQLGTLPDESVHCCVTSPPYWGLRDYGESGQLGLEATPEEYVTNLVEVFRKVRRVLRRDGTLWLNLGDCYVSSPRGNKTPGGGNLTNSNIVGSGVEEARWRNAKAVDKTKAPGLKSKDLVGIPWLVAFALRADGWYLRSDIVWSKPNPVPESVTDRPTKAHEYLFLLSKSERYYYDAETIREGVAEDGTPGSRNRRTVWTLTTQRFPDAHFAVMPAALVRPCILAGTSSHGVCPTCRAPWKQAVTGEWQPICTCDWRADCGPPDPVPPVVLDPFMGSGTVADVAQRLGRDYLGIEINEKYAQMAEKRVRRYSLDSLGMFNDGI